MSSERTYREGLLRAEAIIDGQRKRLHPDLEADEISALNEVVRALRAEAVAPEPEADQPWKRCPSTHCERREECASPSECSARVTPEVVDWRARAEQAEAAAEINGRRGNAIYENLKEARDRIAILKRERDAAERRVAELTAETERLRRGLVEVKAYPSEAPVNTPDHWRGVVAAIQQVAGEALARTAEGGEG